MGCCDLINDKKTGHMTRTGFWPVMIKKSDNYHKAEFFFKSEKSATIFVFYNGLAWEPS